MSTAACQQVMDQVGDGVAASLRAVDCIASATAQDAFGRLFGTQGALLPALTILLTLYVAFFAFSLITGRSRLGVSALTPRMITLGLVLTFATSWIAYQGVVWNLAVGAPDQIAALLTGVNGSATQVFADKIDLVFAALTQTSGQVGAGAGGQQAATSTFSPPGLLWLGATLLLLGTAGILATCKIALAILLALGPVFVVLALFPATRGLTAGWIKGVVMLAITPLFAVLGGSLMLELSVPVLRALVQTPGMIDPKAAMAFFMIGAVHMALMIMVLKVSGTIVAGWSVFGLSRSASDERDAAMSQSTVRAAPISVAAPLAAEAASPRASPAPARRINLAATGAPVAANDAGPASAPGRRDTRLVASAAGQAAAAPSPSRARGIGSRFRTPQHRTMEKFK